MPEWKKAVQMAKSESVVTANYFSMLSQWQLRLSRAWCQNWQWHPGSHIHSVIFIIYLFPISASLHLFSLSFGKCIIHLFNNTSIESYFSLVHPWECERDYTGSEKDPYSRSFVSIKNTCLGNIKASTQCSISRRLLYPPPLLSSPESQWVWVWGRGRGRVVVGGCNGPWYNLLL